VKMWCCVVLFIIPVFQGNLLPPCSGSKSKPGVEKNCVHIGIRGTGAQALREPMQIRRTYLPYQVALQTLLRQQPRNKIGSGFTYKCDFPIHHLPWDQNGLPEYIYLRMCCRCLNWFVVHDEVVSLMHNPLQGGPGMFLSGTHTPSPCSSHYSCRAVAAVLICPEYFISPVPSTYIGDEHSAIHHLGKHLMGDRQLHTGNKENRVKNIGPLKGPFPMVALWIRWQCPPLHTHPPFTLLLKWPSVSLDFPISPVDSLRAIISPICSVLGKMWCSATGTM
jgi:hypothetical protein